MMKTALVTSAALIAGSTFVAQPAKVRTAMVCRNESR